jgi:hypothetical protein
MLTVSDRTHCMTVRTSEAITVSTLGLIEKYRKFFFSKLLLARGGKVVS